MYAHTAFATLFLAAIGYNRLELTISRDEKWQAAQAEEMIATVMQQVYGMVLGEWVGSGRYLLGMLAVEDGACDVK